VCTVLDAPRSTIYARRSRQGDDNVIPLRRPGPVGAIDDEQLLALIRQVLADSPFTGEGYRKVHARLRREHGVRVGRKRVLRLMRRASAARPAAHQRAAQAPPARRHDRPRRAGRDVGHRCHHGLHHRGRLGVAVRRDRPLHRRSLDPPRRPRRPLRRAAAGLRRRHRPVRGLEADVARGISLRHDWGPQYRSGHFTGSIRWLGIDDSPAYVGEPETNGCAERFIRTLKEQCLWARPYATIDELRQAVAEFTHLYNTEWLIERHGHRTPREARADAMTSPQAA
jgi:putative transposase